MADPFVSEIRIFPFNFPPTGWAFCDGQLLPLSQNTALYSLLGTTYGGDGKSTFALPDLQGSAPMHPGWGPGLTERHLGEVGGEHAVSLQVHELPAHGHQAMGVAEPGTSEGPGGMVWAAGAAGRPPLYGAATNLTAMSPQALNVAGGGQPHNNMQPYLVLNFCICMQGVYPPRP